MLSSEISALRRRIHRAPPWRLDPCSPSPDGALTCRHPSSGRKELARVVARLFALRYPTSPTDHAETEATYFSDLDGNGIELTFETPERGELAIEDGQPVARMADGKLQPGTAALDVPSLLGELSTEDDLSQSMPTGTRIGHVHLHVGDMDGSIRFYQDIIGFGPHLNMSSFRMADVSLKTSFIPHALAINTWQGAGAPPPPEYVSGLRHWTLMLPDRDAVNEIASRITDADFVFTMNDNGIRIADPSRNEVHIASEN